MATSTTSVRLPDEILADLDALAHATDRTRNYWITEAVKEFVQREAYHIRRIHQGLAEADAGAFVPDDAMDAFWDEWTAGPGLDRARAEAAREAGEQATR